MNKANQTTTQSIKSSDLTKDQIQSCIKWEGYKTLKDNQFDLKCKEIEKLGVGSFTEHKKSFSTV